MRAWTLPVTLLVAAAPQLAAAQDAPPAKTMGFQEVLESVRKNNAALEAVRAQAKVADAQVDKAYTAWQPQLNLIGSVQLNSQEQTFDIGSFVDVFGLAFPTIITRDQVAAAKMALANAGVGPTVIQPHVLLAGVLSLNQTLFNITALRAPGVAKAARRAALAQVGSIEDDLLFGAATLYATAGGLKGLEAASDRAIAVAEQRLRDAKVQLEAGTATPLVVTRAETERTAAVGQKTTVQSQRHALLANLRALVGAEGDVDVMGERIAEKVVPKAGNDVESRSSVVARKLQAEAAEKAIGLSDMNWLPTLVFDGQVRATDQAVGFANDHVVASATINLVIPLYDRGVRYADTHIAEAQALAAKMALENERRSARAYLDEARSTLESARSELETAKAQLKLATEAVKQAEDLVQHGLATNLDLSDADSKRFAADQLVVQKELALDLATLRAYYASGGKLLAE